MEQFRRLEAARATVDPKRLRRANEAVSLAQDWDTEARLSQEARSASDTRELAEARREYSASKQRVKGILRRQRSDAETNANQMRTVREAVLTAQRQLDRLADDGPSPLGSDLDHQQSTGTDAGVIPPAVSRRLTDFDSTLLPILLSAAQQLRRGGDDYPRYVASGFRYVLLEVVSAQSPPDGRSDRERVAELLKSTSWGVITDRVIGKLSGIMKARTSSAAEIEAAVHASYGSLRLLLESPAGAQGTIDAYSFVDRGISTE